MIKKISIAPILLILAVWFGAASVSAQVRPRLNRILNNQSVDNDESGDPQLGGRRANRRMLNNQQANGQQAPVQARKKKLQALVMQRLGLTPDQRIRMRDIRQSHDDEIIGAGRRIRQARTALDRAIMSENYSEAEVRRATEDLASAQADRIRLQSRIRAQVRGVLTNDQVQEFHRLERELRLEMQQQKRDMQQQGAVEPKQPGAGEEDETDIVGLLLFDN